MTEEKLIETINALAAQTPFDLSRPSDPISQIFTYFKEIETDVTYKKLYKPILEGLDPATSSGYFLDNLAAHWSGISRSPAVKTQGKMRIYVDRNINIAKDSVFQTAGGQEFKVIDATTVETPNGLVSIEAVKTGSDANMIANTPLTPQRVLGGFKSATLEAGWISQVGKNEETDEEVRLRIKTNDTKKALGDLPAKYVATAEEVVGVRNAVVWRVPRGAGSADIVLAACDGIVTEEMLKQVKDYLLIWGQVGWDISVVPARKEVLEVKVEINNPSLTEEKVRESIAQYALSLPIAGTFDLKDVYERLNHGINIINPVRNQTAEQYGEWEVVVVFEAASKKAPLKEFFL